MYVIDLVEGNASLVRGRDVAGRRELSGFFGDFLIIELPPKELF